ncbi:MAG: CHASE sensor domain-containing protein, partial [Phycisphaerae bacterium]
MTFVLRNMAIKYKLMTIVMLACILGLVLAGVAFLGWERNSLRYNAVSILSTQAAINAEYCKAALAFQDNKDAEKALQALHVDHSIVFGGIYDNKNELFAAYYRDNNKIKAVPAEFKKQGFFFSNDSLVVSAPIVLDNEIIGTICIQSDLENMSTTLKRGAQIIIAVMFISLIAVFMVSTRLQRVISGPILSLANVAKTVSEKKDYSVRALKYCDDEVGLLINAFNEMLEQIQQRDAELVGAKGKLEMRVEERTAELTTTNEQLTSEINVRKKTEGQLRKAEENYRTQFEGSLDAIFVADAETGILTDCNPAATRLVEREKAELIGQP